MYNLYICKGTYQTYFYADEADGDEDILAEEDFEVAVASDSVRNAYIKVWQHYKEMGFDRIFLDSVKEAKSDYHVHEIKTTPRVRTAVEADKPEGITVLTESNIMEYMTRQKEVVV